MPGGWPKGKKRGTKTGGRPPGKPNFITKEQKISALQRVDEIDATLSNEDKGLLVQARLDPKWFYETFYKLRIPKSVEVSGPEGGPINAKVEIVFADDKHKS